MAALIKESVYWSWPQFLAGKHGRAQAAMVLDRPLRAPYLDHPAAGGGRCAWLERLQP